jgi:hypothetical protein
MMGVPAFGDRRWLIVGFLAITMVTLAGFSVEANAQSP